MRATATLMRFAALTTLLLMLIIMIGGSVHAFADNCQDAEPQDMVDLNVAAESFQNGPSDDANAFIGTYYGQWMSLWGDEVVGGNKHRLIVLHIDPNSGAVSGYYATGCYDRWNIAQNSYALSAFGDRGARFDGSQNAIVFKARGGKADVTYAAAKSNNRACARIFSVHEKRAGVLFGTWEQGKYTNCIVLKAEYQP